MSNVNAVGDERSLVDQLRLQEEYDLRNAIKASEQAAAQPEQPLFLPPIVPPIVEGPAMHIVESPRQSARGDNEPQGRPGRNDRVRVSAFRTNQIAEQLETGQFVDPEEMAR